MGNILISPAKVSQWSPLTSLTYLSCITGNGMEVETLEPWFPGAQIAYIQHPSKAAWNMPSSQRVPHAIATNQQTCWNNTPSWWIKTLLGTLSHSCLMVPSLVVPSKHRQAPSPTAWVRLDLYFPPRPGLEWVGATLDAKCAAKPGMLGPRMEDVGDPFNGCFYRDLMGVWWAFNGYLIDMLWIVDGYLMDIIWKLDFQKLE